MNLNIRYGHTAVQLVGCGPLFNHNDLETADCLRKVPAELIQMTDVEMGGITKVKLSWKTTIYYSFFQPVVDGDYNLSHSAFIPLDPHQAITAGDYNTEVDVLYGIQSTVLR